MSHAPSPASSPKPLTSRWGCGQAILGLILGGATAITLILADPFDVTAFTEPQGGDFAQRQTAYDQWKRSPRVIIGSSAMTLIPLLVSGACGIFAHRFFPSSIAAALLRMTGIASLLLLVSTAGSRAIDCALSTGESSDIRTPLAMLAFEALCISLAAPLSSIMTRRRPRRGHPLAEATR
jgi:hypothetical protein